MQADRVVAHLQKKARPAAEDAPAGAFVWKKKVEKQLQEGASVRDLTAAAERKRQEDREVPALSCRSQILWKVAACCMPSSPAVGQPQITQVQFSQCARHNWQACTTRLVYGKQS